MRHGYDFIRFEDFSYDKSIAASWNKVRFCQTQLDVADWVFWTDADSVVMNPETRLEDIIRFAADDQFMIVCRDVFDINMGQFLFRNCLKGREFLDRLWKERFHYPSPNWEQDATRALCDTNSSYWAGMKILPQHVMNSYDYETLGHRYPSFCEGDFIFHFAGMGNQMKLEKTRNSLAKIGF